MGQATPQEHKLHIEVLEQILKGQGFKVTPVKLASLLMWVRPIALGFLLQELTIVKFGQRWERKYKQRNCYSLKFWRN